MRGLASTQTRTKTRIRSPRLVNVNVSPQIRGRTMQLKDGDRVKHPTLKAWGLGQVIGNPVGNTVKVFFVGVGEKTIALDYASLIPVSGPEASSPLLDNLRRP